MLFAGETGEEEPPAELAMPVEEQVRRTNEFFWGELCRRLLRATSGLWMGESGASGVVWAGNSGLGCTLVGLLVSGSAPRLSLSGCLTPAQPGKRVVLTGVWP